MNNPDLKYMRDIANSLKKINESISRIGNGLPTDIFVVFGDGGYVYGAFDSYDRAFVVKSRIMNDYGETPYIDKLRINHIYNKMDQIKESYE